MEIEQAQPERGHLRRQRQRRGLPYFIEKPATTPPAPLHGFGLPGPPPSVEPGFDIEPAGHAWLQVHDAEHRQERELKTDIGHQKRVVDEQRKGCHSQRVEYHILPPGSPPNNDKCEHNRGPQHRSRQARKKRVSPDNGQAHQRRPDAKPAHPPEYCPQHQRHGREQQPHLQATHGHNVRGAGVGVGLLGFRVHIVLNAQH